tara:strand:+ start:1404 stop:1601 length:198 start_codon:yes stop_codon:yes gene_type:complete
MKAANKSRAEDGLIHWAVPVVLEVDGEEVRLDIYISARTKKASRKRAMRVLERLASGFDVRDDGL